MDNARLRQAHIERQREMVRELEHAATVRKAQGIVHSVHATAETAVADRNRIKGLPTVWV